ncbi:MAG: hypothetical protein KAS71_15650 [Bacteroidales bacterium]|nr:hypothetical protein [Bacteroidales bacterium]
MKIIASILFCLSIIINTASGQEQVRIGVAGLSHSHVLPLLRNLDREDIKIVGIAERDPQLMDRYAKEFSLDKDILFESLDEMLDQTKPENQ